MLHNRLAQLREERAEGDRGFTLIELLVVVVIIGVLIAIAIPLYLNYTKGANDKSAQSDLRGAVSALEQCNSDNSSYPTAVATTGGVPTDCTGQNVKLSKSTVLTYLPSSTTAGSVVSYVAEASNGSGTGTLYCYSSKGGGSVQKVTTALLSAFPSGGLCPA